MDDDTPKQGEDKSAAPLLFWVILGSALIALGGGATLLVLSQTGALGATGGVGPGLMSEAYVEGQRVDIWWRERWQPGAVTKKADDRYQVHYDGFDASFDEWVDASRLRPRQDAAPAPD